MRYCLQCGSEYRDEIKQCTDCGSTELVHAEQMQGRSQPLPHPVDLRQQFVVAGTAEDPLSAEREVQLLQAAGIPAILRARGGGTIDNLTSPAAPWWEILAPQESVARATELIHQDRAQLEANAEEATRAAEEEEAEQEQASRKG
jgi:predicted  nucleic acid-binding Zn-ribbon protein